MCGSQCSVSGRRSLCHRHRGAERLLVWWYTGAADCSGNTSEARHIHQAQVSSKITLHACHHYTVATSKFQPFHTFQQSTKTHGHFFWFSGAACCVRYIALSLMTPGAVWSSAVRLMSPRSSFVSWCFPSSLPTATVTFNFEGVFLSSGPRGKEKKKKTTRPTSDDPAVL